MHRQGRFKWDRQLQTPNGYFLFNLQPEEKSRSKFDSNYVFYTAKKQFGNANNFLKKLTSFDKDSIPQE
jgi:hypothetical protein